MFHCGRGCYYSINRSHGAYDVRSNAPKRNKLPRLALAGTIVYDFRVAHFLGVVLVYLGYIWQMSRVSQAPCDDKRNKHRPGHQQLNARTL